jgi:hypothetical protein
VTTEPTRLLQDEDLTQTERTLLNAGRVHDVSPQELQRAFERFSAVIAAESPSDGPSSGQPVQASRVPWGSLSLVAKKFGLLAAALCLLGGAYGLSRERPVRLPAAGTVKAAVAEKSAEDSTLALSPELDPEQREALVPEPAVKRAEPERGASSGPPMVRKASRKRGLPRHVPTPPGVATTAGLQEQAVVPPVPAPVSEPLAELRAMMRARSLVPKAPAEALSLLEELARGHPDGQLVEERRALLIFALTGTGNTSRARAEARSFLRDYPNGPFAARVAAATAP